MANIPNQATTFFSANKGNRGFGNQLSDSGHRPNENVYRVIGMVINDYSNAAPGGPTGLNLGGDAIQEFSVITTGTPPSTGGPQARSSMPLPARAPTSCMEMINLVQPQTIAGVGYVSRCDPSS